MSEDCTFGDAECAGDVDLDQIMGGGTHDAIESALQDISNRHVAGIAAFGVVSLPCDEWIEHFDGAMSLAEMLDSTAVALTRGATYDDDGEVVSDPDLEFQVADLLMRCETAIPVLDAVLLLSNEENLVAFAAALDDYGTSNFEQLETLRIHAETGASQLKMLFEEFEKHQDLYAKYLKAGTKDTMSLAIGGVGTAIKTLEPLKVGWSLANAFNTTVTAGDDWHTTAKKLKSIGSASVSEITRALASSNPFKVAWSHIGVGITICETIIDLGLTATEAAQMYRVLGLAQQVQAEYGPYIAFYDANVDGIRECADLMSRLSLCSERVTAAADRAEALVAGAGGDALYYPKY